MSSRFHFLPTVSTILSQWAWPRPISSLLGTKWRGIWGCPWLAAATRADAVILHAGDYHGGSDLNSTLRRVRPQLKPAARLVVRGAHAPRCDGQVGPAVNTSDILSRYDWWRLPKRNAEEQRDVEKSLDALYLNVWPLSMANGQGRRDPPRDCVHYCLPGPIDQWTRLLLALLIDQRVRKKGQSL
jgi:hypothetical protein|mmetsp:Transcript_34298/g.77740  ORF Transcript_34298/g.77740 Transcript_34298/m.77740 type:complete len:185 (+) Transcript_34298:693-1247(+)|eukprot:CAMPEP_0181219158 /NCGR_PEP_ID=MMETSP1096-20121128/28103_1 /TAXON_ID=156174 ORGANISM="Chrysochromulina ericina, Strain CCMP281" /NCGR_SAMPLE_ID=MMETSP1096 /ASSEMBLY_ACC=CAM_ASM_000453 /LENGTH=184 /DNA_ID=CAMNT_0023311473 /DNA_START=880 /DNA_END=1434 /DNA_ORIENTATION=-